MSPAFQNVCGTSRRARTPTPGSATIWSSPSWKPSCPERTYHASSSSWWTWRGAIQWSPTSAVHRTITKSSSAPPRRWVDRSTTLTTRDANERPGAFSDAGGLRSGSPQHAPNDPRLVAAGLGIGGRRGAQPLEVLVDERVRLDPARARLEQVRAQGGLGERAHEVDVRRRVGLGIAVTLVRLPVRARHLVDADR